MEAGIEFFGNGSKITMGYEVTTTVAMDVQSTYGVDYGIENHTTCTAEGKEGAGLYQWVVSTGDFMRQAFTWHTVCRTGELWNKPPECPYYSCANADCSVCHRDWEDDSSDSSIDDGGAPESLATTGHFTPVMHAEGPDAKPPQ